MRALTLWQPWAQLVAEGIKPIENRSWEPPRSVLGQRIAIHAGKRYEVGEWKYMLDAEEDHVRDVCERAKTISGCIVGTAVVAAYARADELDVGGFLIRQSRWFVGPVGWLLKDIVRLPEPIPCRGAQGLWTLPPDIEAKVLEFTRRDVPGAGDAQSAALPSLDSR